MAKPDDVRKLILNVGEKGRIFTVKFNKRSDNTERTMVCRLGVQKGRVNKDKTGNRYNPESKDILFVYDMQAKGRPDRNYRSIPLDAVKEVHGKKGQYKL